MNFDNKEQFEHDSPLVYTHVSIEYITHRFKVALIP
jgi:hypothetical protein